MTILIFPRTLSTHLARFGLFAISLMASAKSDWCIRQTILHLKATASSRFNFNTEKTGKKYTLFRGYVGTNIYFQVPWIWHVMFIYQEINTVRGCNTYLIYYRPFLTFLVLVVLAYSICSLLNAFWQVLDILIVRKFHWFTIVSI